MSSTTATEKDENEFRDKNGEFLPPPPMPQEPSKEPPPNYIPPMAFNYQVDSYIQLVPIGQNMVPHKVHLNNKGRIFTADFYPKCTQKGTKSLKKPPLFEPFSVLIQQANHWLQEFPTYSLLSCESIECDSTHEGEVSFQDSVRFESAFGQRLFVRGLRLWLHIDPAQTVAQQIWYINVMPRYLKHSINEFETIRTSAGGMVESLGIREPKTPIFEDLNTTVQHFNQMLKVDPLAGEILTIEVLKLSLANAKGIGAPVNLDLSHWAETTQERRTYLNCLRIFYIQGQPQANSIGIQIFSPTVILKGDKLKYEDYTTLSPKVFEWMRANQNLTVKNISTVTSLENFYERPHDKHQKPLPLSNPLIDSYRTVNIAFANDKDSGVSRPLDIVRSLAICFVTQGRAPPEYSLNSQPANEKQMLAFPSPVIEIGAVSSRIFIPYKVTKATYETTYETLLRVSEWMDAAKCQLSHIETMAVYHTPEHEKVPTDEMSTRFVFGKGMHKLVCYRVYFTGPVYEPHPSFLSPPPKVKVESSACTIL